MDQSKSNKKEVYHAPKKTYGLEFWVGIFSAVSLAALAYLAVGLGELEVFSSDAYILHAEFDNISGVEKGASVEIAGVQVGSVADISLNAEDSVAHIKLKVDQGVAIRDDDIASIRTKGIIGDRYVKIIPGGSDILLQEGDFITETESVVDIEDLIGKFVHNLDSNNDE